MSGDILKTMATFRFMDKVDKGDGKGCWKWCGARTSPRTPSPTVKPYGQFWHEGKTQSAHRVSYKLFKGDIPRGLQVMHTCVNPLCVNPDHLRLGYADENIADKIRKGRHYKKGT